MRENARADEKPIAFVELERTIYDFAVSLRCTGIAVLIAYQVRPYTKIR